MRRRHGVRWSQSEPLLHDARRISSRSAAGCPLKFVESVILIDQSLSALSPAYGPATCAAE
ncbi:hypothetical protein B194_2030 [Serratia plymuthica A30]|nr:hypothetical protein B194_2030 [Serratia plymuthica A30]